MWFFRWWSKIELLCQSLPYIKLIVIRKMGCSLAFKMVSSTYCSMYGGNRILTEEYGDLEILSYDVGQGVVRARDIYHQQPRVVFKLSTAEGKSDRDLFVRKIVARWVELKKDYEGDPDYTDYLPAFYDTLKDMDDGKMHIIRDV